MAKKRHKMTAGAASGVGRLEKIGKKPAPTPIRGEGDKGRSRSDKAPRR